MAVHPAAPPARPAQGRRRPTARSSSTSTPPPRSPSRPSRRTDARLGKAYVPADRVSAQAYASFTQATVITVPKEVVASAPTVVSLRGEGGVAYGHTIVILEPFAQATVVLDHTGTATYADNVEFVVGDGASLSVFSLQNWAAGRGAPVAPARAARPRRAVQELHRQPRRRASSASRRRCPMTPRAATPSCTASTSSTRASTWSTGCSSTTPSRAAAAASTTAARCRTRARTPSGSAT